MVHRAVVAVGAIVAHAAIVMRHSDSSREILALRAVAMAPSAALHLDGVSLVAISDIGCSSAGLNFIVQLKYNNRRNN